MSEIISSKVVTARKDHRCALCGLIAIAKGEDYERTTYKFEERLYTWIVCVPCEGVTQKAMNEGYESGDGGIGPDEAQEWAQDFYKEDPLARAFLERYGYSELDIEEMDLEK